MSNLHLELKMAAKKNSPDLRTASTVPTDSRQKLHAEKEYTTIPKMRQARKTMIKLNLHIRFGAHILSKLAMRPAWQPTLAENHQQAWLGKNIQLLTRPIVTILARGLLTYLVEAYALLRDGLAGSGTCPCFM
jgi:hypothetical protein